MPTQTAGSPTVSVVNGHERAIELLRLREEGGPLWQEYNIIDKDDLYSNNPQVVFGDDHIWHTDETEGGVTMKTTYVFAKLTKVSPNSQRYSRVAGDGTWSQENSSKERIPADSGEPFGIRIMLSFRKNDFPKDPTGWNMHEYSLRREAPTNSRSCGIYVSDRVLCKITKVCVLGSVPPTPTSIASSSNKENSTAVSDAELMDYMDTSLSPITEL